MGYPLVIRDGNGNPGFVDNFPIKNVMFGFQGPLVGVLFCAIVSRGESNRDAGSPLSSESIFIYFHSTWGIPSINGFDTTI